MKARRIFQSVFLVFLYLLSLQAFADKPIISEIQTTHLTNDRVILTIKGRNLFNFKPSSPFISIENGDFDYTLIDIYEDEIMIKTELTEGEYIVQISSDNKFENNTTANYELSISRLSSQRLSNQVQKGVGLLQTRGVSR